MLSLNDLKHKQILFIESERGCKNSIKFWNENIRYVKDGVNINQMSCHNVLATFVMGDMSLTTKLIEKCKNHGISIFLLKNNMDCYASILSSAEGNYELRRKQYTFRDDLKFSKHLVKNKILNQSIGLKDPSWADNFLKTLENAKTNKEILGAEGSSSKDYFKKFFAGVDWKGRSPRTKRDITNLLLDIGYSYLFNYIDCLLRLYGFDTYKGIYHKLFFQRRSLSCDIMEPFRVIIDKALLKAYHLNQIDQSDFYLSNSCYRVKYKLSAKYSKIFVETIASHREEIYEYVKKFYIYIMDSTKKPPLFLLKKR
jgi:CRISPR-associated protein Cas1